ncbi:MAG: triose-phosphate isomerase, partial [Planctomycetota bacterium]
MRKPFIAGNWKMNTDSASAVALAAGLAKELSSVDTVDVAVCPPFVYLQSVLGSQNVYFEEKGAFTGEISCAMLKDTSCAYAIIGHSERRHVMGESDAMINKKISAAISGGLLPIFCVGELLEERQGGTTNEVVAGQIKNGLEGICAESIQAVTVAYEPVWAIGTGLTATPEQAQEVHAMIRGLLADLYGNEIAQTIRIQYGGSAKPGNTAELMSQPDVDGLLVGGASLKVEDF